MTNQKIQSMFNTVVSFSTFCFWPIPSGYCCCCCWTIIDFNVDFIHAGANKLVEVAAAAFLLTISPHTCTIDSRRHNTFFSFTEKSMNGKEKFLVCVFSSFQYEIQFWWLIFVSIWRYLLTMQAKEEKNPFIEVVLGTNRWQDNGI